MPQFLELLGPYYPFAMGAQSLLTLWMLIDWRRRGGEAYWMYVILFFQPFGAWAYFALVKTADGRGGQGGNPLQGLFHRPASVEELRYKAEHIPTLANRLALAQRLVEKREFAAALEPLQAAWKTEPDHGQILYSLALCHTRLGRPLDGIPHLERLLARDPRWSNYIAWHLLVEARQSAGDLPGALQACRELVRLCPTLQHNCLLAEHLLAQGQEAEASQLLDRSLRDHSFAPAGIRHRNRRWAGEAKRLRRTMASR
jgi:hypothetical protein